MPRRAPIIADRLPHSSKQPVRRQVHGRAGGPPARTQCAFGLRAARTCQTRGGGRALCARPFHFEGARQGCTLHTARWQPARLQSRLLARARLSPSQLASPRSMEQTKLGSTRTRKKAKKTAKNNCSRESRATLRAKTAPRGRGRAQPADVQVAS